MPFYTEGKGCRFLTFLSNEKEYVFMHLKCTVHELGFLYESAMGTFIHVYM